MTSALTAAAMSPDIPLAQAVSEFVADLSDEQKVLFKTQQKESLPPKDKDIIVTIAEIHGVAASGQASNLVWREPRMTNFLKAVHEFASLQDDTPDKSLSSQAGSVWLLVRLTFMVCPCFGGVHTDLIMYVETCSDASLARSRIGIVHGVQPLITL
jgi:hypothetical protein